MKDLLISFVLIIGFATSGFRSPKVFVLLWWVAGVVAWRR